MGRNKRKHKHLPPRMRFEHGAYYYADARGGRKPWVLIGRTRTEALLKYAHLEAAVTDRRDFAALVRKYTLEGLPKLAESTRKVYATLLKKPLKVFGAVMPDAITQQDAYRYMDERGKAIGRSEIGAVSAVLTFGVMKGWVRSNPLHGMKFGKVSRRKRYLSDAELHAILAKCSPELSQAVRFLHYTALRTIDARRVRWSDWKADGLHVRISKTSSALILTRTPGLEGLMSMMRNRHIASVYVLAERNGSAWSYKRMYAEWQKVAPEDANLHDLRRKRLTDLTRERGVDFAQSLAAHSDPRMTQSYVSGEQRVVL